MRRILASRMAVGLAFGITASVLIASAAGAFLYSVQHHDSILDLARKTATSHGALILNALEHQMMENDRALIAKMIRGFGEKPPVESVVLLDRLGSPRYASGTGLPGEDLSLSSPTCQACHRDPPTRRNSSRVIETRGGSLLRTVIPVTNRAECHRCHDALQSINGVLVVDVDIAEIRGAMRRDLAWMVAGTALLALTLAGALAVVVRLVVVRRLQRFAMTARQIAAGDRTRRVPAEGSDTIAWLAREFNSMADSLGDLLAEVENQGERLETVINSIDDGIVVLDTDRKVITANEAFLRRAGRFRPGMLGTPCLDLTGGMCSAGECPAQSCMKTSERQVSIHERRTIRGEAAWEEVHASPVLGPDGRVLYVVEVWRDISGRRAAEARLAESHRLASLGLLAAGFSHELNTPLATTLACVEGILRDSRPGRREATDWERVGQRAATAREQLLRCRGVTQNFLRLSSGKAPPGGIVGLEPTLAEVARLVEPTARAHAVIVEVEPRIPEVRVRVNEAGLQHVLLNLLLNAIQACREGGHVKMSVDDGDPIRIRVTDDGRGVPQEVRERIFEPFLSGREGGTGLGLFLSLNFMQKWGGGIRLEETTARGSTFEVWLPSLESPSPEEVSP